MFSRVDRKSNGFQSFLEYVGVGMSGEKGWKCVGQKEMKWESRDDDWKVSAGGCDIDSYYFPILRGVLITDFPTSLQLRRVDSIFNICTHKKIRVIVGTHHIIFTLCHVEPVVIPAGNWTTQRYTEPGLQVSFSLAVPGLLLSHM